MYVLLSNGVSSRLGPSGEPDENTAFPNDFQIDYVQNLSDTAAGPSLTTAVQDIGLKLIQTKAPIRHLIIDHAENP